MRKTALLKRGIAAAATWVAAKAGPAESLSESRGMDGRERSSGHRRHPVPRYAGGLKPWIAAALVLAAGSFAAPAWGQVSWDNGLSFSDLGNDHPEAVSYGVLFHESYPDEMRELVVEDLLWLHGLGELPDSSGLASMLGLERPYAIGADLVDWFVQYSPLIARSCPARAKVLVGAAFRLERASRNKETELLICDWDFGMISAGAIALDMFRPLDPDEMVIGDGFALLRPTGLAFSIQFSGIGMEFAKDDWLSMLSTLFHEVWHYRVRWGHVECPLPKYPLLIADEERPPTTCDQRIHGAYGFEAEFNRALFGRCQAGACGSKGTVLVDDMAHVAAAVWVRIREGTIEGLRLVPSERHFQVADMRLAELQSGCSRPECEQAYRTQRVDLERYRRQAETAHEEGRLLSEWRLPVADLESHLSVIRDGLRAPEGAADAWVEAIRSGRHDRFNVQHRDAVPCALFESGCP